MKGWRGAGRGHGSVQGKGIPLCGQSGVLEGVNGKSGRSHLEFKEFWDKGERGEYGQEVHTNGGIPPEVSKK